MPDRSKILSSLRGRLTKSSQHPVLSTELTSNDQAVTDVFPLIQFLKGVTPPDGSADVARDAEQVRPGEWKAGDRILGMYEIRTFPGGEPFREGGMGRVYRIFHLDWRIDLAVKVPLTKAHEYVHAFVQLEQEAVKWVKLPQHLHVAFCWYVRRLGDLPCVFTEFVSDGSLADWIHTRRLYENGPKRALGRVLDVAIQMAWGLQHIHDNHLVHQDLKPANVLMTAANIAKVTDLGLAGVEFSGGTPPYYSPEQAEAAASPHADHLEGSTPYLTVRSDLWSWAIVVLEMFMGELPSLYGKAAAEVLESFIERGSTADGVPPMPEDVAQLLRHCFSVDVDQRPQDMRAVADTLRNIYRRELDEEYPRSEPKASQKMADALNNRGASLVDLGKHNEAIHELRSALEHDPRHPEAIYNLGLTCWRRGMGVATVIKQLEGLLEFGDLRGRAAYLLSWIHVERGDAAAAHKALGGAEQAGVGMGVLGEAKRAADSIKGYMAVDRLEKVPTPITLLRLKLDPINDHLATAGPDGLIQLWDLETGRCVVSMKNDTTVSAVSFTPDGRRLVAGSYNGILSVWDLNTGRRERILEKTEDVRCDLLAVHADGRHVAAAFSPWRLRDLRHKSKVGVWNLETGQCLWTSKIKEGCLKFDIVSNNVGGPYVVCQSIRSVRAFRLLDGSSFVLDFKHLEEAGACAVAPNGKVFWARKESFWDRGESRSSYKNGIIFSHRSAQFRHDAPVHELAISSDGRLLLSFSAGDSSVDYFGKGEIRVWYLQQHEPRQSPRIKWIRAGYGLLVSPDSRFVISLDSRKQVSVWDLETGDLLQTIEGDLCRYLIGGILTRDGRRMVLFKNDRETIQMFERECVRRAPFALVRALASEQAAEEQRLFEDHMGVARKAHSRGDFKRAVQHARAAREVPGYLRHPDSLELWVDLQHRCQLGDLRDAWFAGHYDHSGLRPMAVAFDLSGSCMAIGSFDKLVFEDLNERSSRKLSIPEEFRIYSRIGVTYTKAMALSWDGRRAVSVFKGCPPVFVWDVKEETYLNRIEHVGDAVSVALTPDGRKALFAMSYGYMELWDLEEGQRCKILSTPGLRKKDFSQVAMTPDARFAVSAGKHIRIWDLENGHCVKKLNTPAWWWSHGRYLSVALLPDLRRVVAGLNELEVWDLESGKCLNKLEGHTDVITSIAIFQDGRHALSGSLDRTLRLWDLESYRCLRILESDEQDSVFSVAISDCGWLVASADSRNVNFWYLDWELRARDPADWHEGAKPFLEMFLSCHAPAKKDRPSWSEDDFEMLLQQLACAGFGWLRPEGIRQNLDRMANDWSWDRPRISYLGPPTGV